MVYCYLFCDGIVDGLRHLIHEAGQVLIANAWPVHVDGIQEHFAQPPGRDELMGDTPAFDGRWNERVAESVSGREKANGNRRIHRGVVK